jgi:hypothetical protein
VRYGTLPEVSAVTRRFVVVAVPETVSPPIAVPSPTVEDAYAESEARPRMFWLPPVTAPPKVSAGSVVEKAGTFEPFVTRMEEAAAAVAWMAPVPFPKRTPFAAKVVAPVPPTFTVKVEVETSCLDAFKASGTPAVRVLKVAVPSSVKFVVEAVAKYPVPETESAVEEA